MMAYRHAPRFPKIALLYKRSNSARIERLRYRAIRLRRGLAKSRLLSFGAAPPAPFVVLCRARSGSNYLLSLLEMHPNTLVYGEKLRAYRPGRSERFLERLHGRRAWWVRATGFKLFYEHPHNVSAPQLWQRLIDDRELMVIHLRRRNLLHVLLSQVLAERRDHWVERTDHRRQKDKPSPVALCPDWLERQFRRIEEQRGAFDQRFSAHHLLRVDYERLVEDAQNEFDRICGFLELPPAPARAYTRRQRRQPVYELISNYAVIEEHFRNSRWAKFFDKTSAPGSHTA